MSRTGAACMFMDDDDGDLAAGRRRYDAAYRAAERVGDAVAMAEAALGLAGLWVHEHRTSVAAGLLHTRLHQALRLVDPASTISLRLRVRIAGEAAYRSGNPEQILLLLDAARAAGDPIALAEALSIAHHCVLGPQYGRLRQRIAAELVQVSFTTGRRSDLLMGVLWQTVNQLLAGDPHAGRRLTELRALLAEGPHLAVGFVLDAIDVMLAIRAGDLDRAEALASKCVESGTAAGDADAVGWHTAHLVTISWYRGRLGQLMSTVTERADSETLSAIDNSLLAAQAVAAAQAGDRRAAVSALAALRGRDLADLAHSSSWLVAMGGIVEAAYLLDDADTAARAYELLHQFADLPMIASLGVVCFGSVHHALGVASLTTGDIDRAVTHLHAAVQRNLALSHWPAVVTSRWRLVAALTRRGRPADLTRARRERAAAEQEAQQAGLPIPDPQPSTVERLVATCVRAGRDWNVTLGGRNVVLKHSVGMLHLAVLLSNPGQDIDALELATGAAMSARTADAGRSNQAVLDPVAIQQYRARLARLRDEIARLEAAHTDDRRLAEVRAERDWIANELLAAAGLGGRAREFTTNRERARIAVGKAIRRAIERIDAADPVLGSHLARTVRTGSRCSYWPA